VRGKSSHQCGITQSVDETRHPAGIAEDLGKAVFGEYLPIRGTRNFETVLYVRAHFRRGQGRQMKSQAYALRELYQLRRVQLLIELGLAGQDDAQHLLFGGLYA